jgi:hypothetical protein
VPLIVDIVDGFSLFERQGDKRAAFYRKHRYPIYRNLAAGLDACLADEGGAKKVCDGGDSSEEEEFGTDTQETFEFVDEEGDR